MIDRERLKDAIAPLKRGKWLAGRTVGLVQRIAPSGRAMNEGEWESLREAVETYANVAIDEAIEAVIQHFEKQSQ